MPRSGTYNWIANNSGLYDDIDMCVTVTTVKGVDPVNAFAGIVFWYSGVNDFYALEIAPNGKASVWRRQRGKWLQQVKWTDAGVNAGDGTVQRAPRHHRRQHRDLLHQRQQVPDAHRLAAGQGPAGRADGVLARGRGGAVRLRRLPGDQALTASHAAGLARSPPFPYPWLP